MGISITEHDALERALRTASSEKPEPTIREVPPPVDPTVVVNDVSFKRIGPSIKTEDSVVPKAEALPQPERPEPPPLREEIKGDGFPWFVAAVVLAFAAFFAGTWVETVLARAAQLEAAWATTPIVDPWNIEVPIYDAETFIKEVHHTALDPWLIEVDKPLPQVELDIRRYLLEQTEEYKMMRAAGKCKL